MGVYISYQVKRALQARVLEGKSQKLSLNAEAAEQREDFPKAFHEQKHGMGR